MVIFHSVGILNWVVFGGGGVFGVSVSNCCLALRSRLWSLLVRNTCSVLDLCNLSVLDVGIKDKKIAPFLSHFPDVEGFNR